MNKSQRNSMKREGCEKNEKYLPNSHNYFLKLHIFLISMHMSTLPTCTFLLLVLNSCIVVFTKVIIIYFPVTKQKSIKNISQAGFSLTQETPAT